MWEDDAENSSTLEHMVESTATAEQHSEGSTTQVRSEAYEAWWYLTTDPEPGSLGGDPENRISGNIAGDADAEANGERNLSLSDTDLDDGGLGTVSVDINLYVFNFNWVYDLSGDNTVAVAGECCGFATCADWDGDIELGGITAVSASTDGPTVVDGFSMYPSASAFVGKPDCDGEAWARKAKFKTEQRVEAKSDGVTRSEGTASCNMWCTFSIPEKPLYIRPH